MHTGLQTVTKRPLRRSIKRFAEMLAVTSALTAVMAGPAGANVGAADIPSLGIEDARQVSDAELSDLRGKYVQPGEVRYFGIDLTSVWTTVDGTILTASLHFVVDMPENGAPTPRLYVSWLQDCDQCNDASVELGGDSFSLNFGSGGLETVSGVVQSNILAGDDNAVRNQMGLTITDDLGSIQQGPPPGMQITESMMQELQNGATIQFVMENNSVGMIMTGGPANGVVTQTVGRGETGNLAQHINLASDFNTIHNVMNVTIGTENLPQIAGNTVNYAMSAMQGNGY